MGGLTQTLGAVGDEALEDGAGRRGRNGMEVKEWVTDQRIGHD